MARPREPLNKISKWAKGKRWQRGGKAASRWAGCG